MASIRTTFKGVIYEVSAKRHSEHDLRVVARFARRHARTPQGFARVINTVLGEKAARRVGKRRR